MRTRPLHVALEMAINRTPSQRSASKRTPAAFRAAPRLAGLAATPSAPVPASQTVAARVYRVGRLERRWGMVVVTIGFLLCGAMTAYAIHSHLEQMAARAAAREMQAALETGAALQSGALLFVPEYGNVCRVRWIDNATGQIRDGGQTICDEEASWNSNLPQQQQQKVEHRIGAIRNTFQTRSGRVE